MAHPSTFYPRRTKTPTQRRAYKHTDTPKRAQTPSKSSFFAAAHILRVPIHPSPSRRFKSDLQLSPTSPAHRSFYLLYRDSNSGVIEGFVRWGIARYPGTFCGVLMIFHIYYHISDIAIHSLSGRNVINEVAKKRFVRDSARRSADLRSWNSSIIIIYKLLSTANQLTIIIIYLC